MASMGRRACRTADECDLKVRHLYCYLQRAGVAKAIKRVANQRDRRAAKRSVWDGWR